MKKRLDKTLVELGLVSTRSQAESWVKLGKVSVDGRVIDKPGAFIAAASRVEIAAGERYVSRAGLKLASVASILGLDFTDKIVLDVGSSTGGFTDYALQHGATLVYAIDVGTEQLHPSLRKNAKVELHEKTDIRTVGLRDVRRTVRSGSAVRKTHGMRQTVLLDRTPHIVLIDVSFVSLRVILPHISSLVTRASCVVAMVKPQFEASRRELGSGGVVKNDTMRRDILRNFETWAKTDWRILAKADSGVTGASGNRERFYLLGGI